MSEMGQRIYAGRTFHLSTPPKYLPHLWVVITDVDYAQCSERSIIEQVVIVNFTTKRAGCDTTVILDAGEHSFIEHETIVNYAYAQFAEVEEIKKNIQTGDSSFDSDCSEALLSKIQQGLLKSRFTPKKIKNYCIQHFKDYW